MEELEVGDRSDRANRPITFLGSVCSQMAIEPEIMVPGVETDCLKGTLPTPSP